MQTAELKEITHRHTSTPRSQDSLQKKTESEATRTMRRIELGDLVSETAAFARGSSFQPFRATLRATEGDFLGGGGSR